MNLTSLWAQGDWLGRGVMLLLLAMSVLSWMVIVYKTWLLARARRSVEGGLAGYWRAGDAAAACSQLERADSLRLLWPLQQAVQDLPTSSPAVRQAQLTRLLRDALQQSSRQLQWGQILLATVGSTAPFVGLLGTVWGIYHALTGLTGGGAISIDRVAGPVGEALIMTAFGLMVAIPAVVAYNIFGRLVASLVERLDGFAHDLLALHGAPVLPPTA